MRTFMSEEVEPLDLLWPEFHHAPPPPWLRKVIDPLKDEVRAQGLWATALSPELGGNGLGNVQLALMNEILGPSGWGPTIFGVQGPDTGNAEILAHYGTEEQKARYLRGLLDGEVFSAFSMTEPQGGADPAIFRTSAVRDGDEWVINGEKFFTSNAKGSAFLIVMAVTNPEVSVYQGTSMFLVPTETPGINMLRQTETMGKRSGEDMGHPHIRYEDVRVGADALLGPEGKGFEVAQIRLSGGRVHHTMRTVGICQKAFDMMCERAVSRETFGGLLGEKQAVQHAIAESYAQIQQFRLFVLYTAWQIDQGVPYAKMRKDISTAKNLAYTVQRDVLDRVIHLHGALGCSNEMPLGEWWMMVPAQGLMDGPWEVHANTVARQVLKDCQPATGLWPTEWLPAKVEAAHEKHHEALTAQADEVIAAA